MTIAVVCLWLKERIGDKISENEIETGAFSEALRLAISELKADISGDENKKRDFNELNDIDSEVMMYDKKTCTEIGIDKCIELFKRYNKVYKTLRGE